MRWTRQRRARLGSQGGSSVSDQGAQDERRQSPAKPLGEDGRLRTAKPCGPGTRCWCQVGGGFEGPTGFSRTANSPTTVTRRIRRRGERGISRKTIVQGMPGCSDCTCMLVCASLCIFAHETAGAACTRRSLRPPLGGSFMHASGALRREIAKSYLMQSNAPHPQSSSPAHAGDPVLQRRQ
jgi:hypothetical protein